MAVVARRVVVFCAGLAVAVLGLVVPASMIAAQVEPPQRGQPFDTLWLSVGDVRDLDASSAFVGSVDAYTATPDNEAAVSVSMTGSVVRLTAVASGVAFIEVSATNAGGSTSQWIGVVSRAAEAVGEEPSRDTGGDSAEGSATSDAGESDTGDAEDMLALESGDPPPGTGAGDESTRERAGETTGGDGGTESGDDARPLAIVLSSWAYCVVEKPGDVRSYDDPDPVRSRGEVARFDVNYAVLGGRGPYVITSPHASSDATDESGVLQMACANPDPDVAGPVYRVDLYDPIEVWAEVTDADGTTARASMVVGRVVGRRHIDHGDGTVTVLPYVLRVENPENDYVVATPAAWTLVALLPNVDLRFASLSTDGIAHFADAGGGSAVWVDWATATEMDRRIVVTADTYSHRVAKTEELMSELFQMGAAWPWEWTPTTDLGELMDG